MTSYEEYETPEPRGWSPIAVALIATLVLLLGLGGALFGIYVANKNAQVATSPTPTPPVTTSSPAVTPSTPGATTTSPPDDSFALPDLVGMDFMAARTKVRELKLGWRLEFEGTEPDPAVRATDPAAGTMVRRGTTVKIFVKGSAPLATVPGVQGLPCGEAARLIVDHGLYPSYPTGRDGVVVSQSPAASDPQTLHWNDEVQISCA